MKITILTNYIGVSKISVNLELTIKIFCTHNNTWLCILLHEHRLSEISHQSVSFC